MDTLSRRRLLQVGGAGTTAAIAGCSAFDSADDDPDGTGEDTETDGSGDETDGSGEQSGDLDGYTLAAAPDEAELGALQQELQAIQQEAMAGELTEEEAEEQQAEVNEEIDELLRETVSGIEEHIDGTDSVSILDAIEERGALLVDGDAEELLALIDRADVNGLFGADIFADAQQ